MPFGRSTRTGCSSLPSICRRRRPRRCSISRSAPRRRLRRRCRRTRTPSRIPMRSAASGSWPTSTSCARRWSIRGSAGPSSCTRRSGSWSSAASAVRRGSRARPAPARPSSRCTGRRIWRGAIRKRAVLVTTFSRRLALALEIKLKRLLDQDPAALARVTVAHVDGIGYRLHELFFGTRPNVASASQIETALVDGGQGAGRGALQPAFPSGGVADRGRRLAAQELGGVPRRVAARSAGPGSAASSARRCGRVFERARAQLHDAQRDDLGGHPGPRDRPSSAGRETSPFTHVVADEAQDLARAAAAHAGRAGAPDDPDALFFAGDLGQRIFQHPFSWLSLGIDVRGRSLSLKVNYRTSHQIRRRADVLLPRQIRDVDGYEDSRAARSRCSTGPSRSSAPSRTSRTRSPSSATWLAIVIDERRAARGDGGVRAHRGADRPGRGVRSRRLDRRP